MTHRESRLCRIPAAVPDLPCASDFDLIIVGAGPAGSNAASVALDAGLRVVQVDAARFPRVKPCAGGVTMKAAAALRYSLEPSVCRSFNTIEFNLWNHRRNRFTHPGTILYTVCRPEFENTFVSRVCGRRAGGFADALTGEGIYYALESGRLAGEVAVDVANGRATHRAYYRRLWGSVLCDTAISYSLARPFYRNVDRGIAILGNPLVWRPLIEGTARGATLGESILKSAAYLFRS